jgi:type I restriction enzyme, S subunit
MVAGWLEVPLKEIAKPIDRSIPVATGTPYRTIGVKWWGMGAYERGTIDGSQTAAKTLSIVREGDLIINKIWVRHGSVAIANKEVDGCTGSGEFPTFELDLNRVDPRWINWQTKMKSFWEKCDSLSRGTSGKNRIKPELFLTIKIPLPPLAEQRRIVARIEALAERIAVAQSLRYQANKETENVLNAARNEIVTNLERNHPIQTLNQLCSKITDGPHVSPSYVPREDGVAFISVRNVSETGIDFTTAQYVSRKDHDDFSKRVNVERGDVLFTKVGSTGTACRVEVDTEFSIWVNLALLKPKREIIVDAFLEHILNAPSVKNQTSVLTVGSSTQYIGLGKIGQIKIPVPPIKEQLQIASYLDKFQTNVASLLAMQAETERELNALMPSILDRAFKGEL